ncbi:MAG: tRNA (adenosine(37)-N6)-threonylcarbamoyltransferase complex dimerization subunit type 1 TsaB [Bacteroidota bacterium]
MAIILCLETSTTNCSVSVSNNEEILAIKELNTDGYSHAESLHVFISEVLDQADIEFSTLDAIAVSKGPGSYTGLRIGVSAAKGLCFALNIPLISTSTLKALALQLQIKDGFVVPMLDARRMEVYSAVYDAQNNLVRDIQAQIIDGHSFTTELNERQVYFLGSGVKKSQEVIQHKNAVFITGKLPSSKQMVSLAYEKYKKSDFEDVAYFEPYYLKDFMISK